MSSASEIFSGVGVGDSCRDPAIDEKRPPPPEPHFTTLAYHTVFIFCLHYVQLVLGCFIWGYEIYLAHNSSDRNIIQMFLCGLTLPHYSVLQDNWSHAEERQNMWASLTIQHLTFKRMGRVTSDVTSFLQGGISPFPRTALSGLVTPVEVHHTQCCYRGHNDDRASSRVKVSSPVLSRFSFHLVQFLVK